MGAGSPALQGTDEPRRLSGIEPDHLQMGSRTVTGQEPGQ